MLSGRKRLHLLDDNCITYRERRVRYEKRRTGNFKNSRHNRRE